MNSTSAPSEKHSACSMPSGDEQRSARGLYEGRHQSPPRQKGDECPGGAEAETHAPARAVDRAHPAENARARDGLVGHTRPVAAQNPTAFTARDHAVNGKAVGFAQEAEHLAVAYGAGPERIEHHHIVRLDEG